LPLRAQIVDQQAALAGTGCVLPGRAKATFGTGVFVLAFTGAVAPAGVTAVGVVPTIAWAVDGLPRYALDGGVFSAGSLLEWLAGGLGLSESPQQLAELAASVETAHGVKLLPALSGLGAPWWNPNARGVVSGLSAGTEPAHLARAAIEAICHRVCDVLDAMRGFVRIEELRIDGGLTQSELLPQLLADLVQVPVVLVAVDATAVGAAGLAAVGAGVLGSVEEIAEIAPAQRRFTPQPRPDERSAWREFVARAAALA
jgi:glycerol kinase